MWECGDGDVSVVRRKDFFFGETTSVRRTQGDSAHSLTTRSTQPAGHARKHQGGGDGGAGIAAGVQRARRGKSRNR